MSAVLRGPAVAVAAVALLAAVVTWQMGPVAVVAVAAALALGVLLLPRLSRTLTGLAGMNLLAVSTANLAGSSYSFADVAAPARAVLSAIFLLQILRLLLSRPVRVLPATASVLPLCGVIVLSLLAAPQLPEDAANAAAFILLIVGVGVVAADAVRRPETSREVLHALAVPYGALVVANVVLLPLVDQPAFISATDGSTRFQGILENPNTVGITTFAAVSMLVGAGMLASRRPVRRAFCFGLAALALAELFASISRGGMAAALVALTVLFLSLTRGRLAIRAMVSLVLVSAALIVGLGGFVQPVVDGLRLSTASEASGRTSAARLVRERIDERPIFGNGYGSEREVFESFGVIRGFRGLYAGNVWLDVTLEMGLMGTLALLFAWGYPIVALLARRTRWPAGDDRRVVRAAFLACAVGAMTSSQSESYGLVPGGASVTALWLSLAMCLAFSRTRPPADRLLPGPITTIDPGAAPRGRGSSRPGFLASR